MSKNYLPRPDAQFLIWVLNFLKNLTLIARKIGFPEDILAELTTQIQRYEVIYKTSQDPATRTKSTIQEKTDARKALEKSIRQAVGEYLSRNHLLTNSDRDLLGLPVYKTTRTPAPVATVFPGTEIDTSVTRQITIYFFPLGGKQSDAKPEGQQSVEIRWAISETPVVDTEALTKSAIDTRSPFTITFQGHERGKTVYFAIRWLNTRGEAGPWSAIENAIIP